MAGMTLQSRDFAAFKRRFASRAAGIPARALIFWTVLICWTTLSALLALFLHAKDPSLAGADRDCAQIRGCERRAFAATRGCAFAYAIACQRSE